jgi:hypothetical protein
MSELPVACTLTADQQRCRAAELFPGLATRAETRTWTAEGIRFTFAPDSTNLDAIARIIDRERRCCAFLRFELVVPPGGGAFVLDLSGPPGTRAFLAALPFETTSVDDSNEAVVAEFRSRPSPTPCSFHATLRNR